MISVLDHMDIDISSGLGCFIEARRNFNKVMKQLEDYVEYNIHLQYISRFTAFECQMKGLDDMYIRCWPTIERLWKNRGLCLATKHIIDCENKSEYLHDWPTKHPCFAKTDNIHLIPVGVNGAELRFGGSLPWKFTKYTPEIYNVKNLAKMCSELKLE